MDKEFLNYFSDSEKSKLKKFADMRTSFFRPLLVLLDKLGFTSNMLSLISILLMIGFVFFVSTNVYYALIFVAGHILLDGIDGSLARYQGKASNGGALVDIGVDHGGIIIAVLATIYFSMVDPFWAALYLVSYTVMIVLVIILNKIGNPAGFIFRSKYYFYALLGIDAYFSVEYLGIFITVVAIYMSLMSVYLFNKLRCSV